MILSLRSFLGGFGDLKWWRNLILAQFYGFSWVLCIQTVNKVNTWTGFHQFTSQSMSSGPKIGVWWLKTMLKPNFCPILWVLRWTFMGFMDLMHTYCKLGKHLDWLPSSYILIYVPGPKIVFQWLKISWKPNIWPNSMGFQVGFHGFYGYYAYNLWIR